MRFLIATDAWTPQINGVVRTLSSLVMELRARGHEVLVVSPDDFRTLPMPTYPEIRLSLATSGRMRRIIEAFDPQSIHIATEGPIGLATRSATLALGRGFTTSFHTRFPEYLRQRLPVPESLSYAFLRWFHGRANACLVPTEAVRRDLKAKGFRNLVTWTRGVDASLFHPRPPMDLGLPGPIFLTVSRVAPEKNLEAFLALDLPGSKVVVGDGPALAGLKRRFPDAHFLGSRSGETLAHLYASADVFVFPSKTDTFGIVLIEALACGTPVAAYPEPGPMDVVAGTKAGCISNDLRVACLAALALDRRDAAERAAHFTWGACADIFLDVLSRPAPQAVGSALPLPAAG
ncbi:MULTISPECIES: glycosyltransferase family 4 protein [unclassified Aureimonas]|uniref:glycosyltransferase family 4 protein n=1 Tax=unclassified Aureimonas TaxID=2615206 RepID=UPI0007017F9B|nr:MULTISPECIES: glycosyltransferase family 1 protein [unclassified Aureimonas]KQT57400.1 alpha-mannosyltransferase [Aureimonas sp. Leaf427]KQT77079.1 alpha-mannosyltransferase [Aureimonas sp. Leaf460]